MEILALIVGFIGGVCTILGIITGAGAMSPLGAAITAMFWLALAGVLFLACIVCLLCRTSYE